MDYQDIAKEVLLIESEAIINTKNHIDSSFTQAVDKLLHTEGKVIIMGVGKSGLIGAKIAATMASTGTSSFFVHPTEALHGDLGMMNDKDMVIAISYSGESQEITTILPHLRRLSIEIIAMCANTTSTLAKQADIVLSIAVKQEACPLNIAPTASTTVTLALGDALSVALMRAKSFAKEDFASFHPGGSLGKRLFVKAADLMICNDLPIANQHTPLQEAIITMSHHRLGILLLINEQHQLVGTLSDGDLRRAMMCEDFALSNAVSTYMSRSPKTSQNVNMLAIEALELIEQYKIQVLLFTNEQNRPIGLLHIHTLVEAGIQ